MVGRTFKPAFSNLTDERLGAPETFRSHIDMEASPLQVTQAVDVWSIGCVFSEASVWAHHGWKRVVEYRRQRSLEIKAKGGDEGEHVFHFDGNLLDAVDNIHQDILRAKQTKDHITRSVVDRLVVEMLQHETRPHAKYLFDKSKRLIKDAEKKFDVSVVGLVGNINGELVDSNEARVGARSPPQVPHDHYHVRGERELPLREPLPPDDDSAWSSSSSRSHSSPHRHHHKSASQSSRPRSTGAKGSSPAGAQGSHVIPLPATPSSTVANTHQNSPQQHVQQPQEEPVRPTLSINEGHEWKRKKKSGEYTVLRGEENLTSLDKRDHVSHVLPRLKLAKRWLQIFLIDTSATMKQYSREIERVISLLAYTVKKSDKDGLDIFFTQSRKKVNSRRSSKLSSSIHQEPFVGISDMRGRLQNILQEHINKFGTLIYPPRTVYGRQPPPQPQRPLSFYILTDAKWQPTDVEGLIRDLVQSMIAKRCPKEHVAIQFIRFGDDQASIDKLDKLDHGLGLKAIGM